ncbi:RagB/SusD family nutrient uptake outer membrane protein [Bacteroidota bacterium]
MKRYIKYIIPVFILYISCEKFEYSDIESNLQSIKTKSELEKAVIGAYAKFAEIFMYGRYRNAYLYHLANADDIELFSEIKYTDYTDEFYTKNLIDAKDNEGNDIQLCNSCYRENGIILAGNEDDLPIDKLYRNSYKAIISQNNIISQYNNIKQLNENDLRMIGEIYFMRAYTYYRLTRLYGKVPLITDLELNYNIKRATIEKIYQQIESDLKKAIQFVPSISNNDKFSTICPNKGSVKALLAEVYLTMGGYPLNDNSKYALAAKYAREVIDSASVYGFELVNNFKRLFKQRTDRNNETISAIDYFNVGERLIPLLETAFENGTFFENPIEQPWHLPGYSNELQFEYLTPIVEVKFFNECPYNFRKKNSYLDGLSIPDKVFIDTIVPLTITSCYLKFLTKYFSIEYFSDVDEMDKHTLYIFRYAHTLLTYAEASARSGNIDDLTYEAINMVRRRANKLPVNTPSIYDISKEVSTELLIDSIVWERAWEFVGEPESRWFDIVRLNMINKYDQLRDINEAPPVYEDILINDYYFPIPDEDVYLNPNLKK